MLPNLLHVKRPIGCKLWSIGYECSSESPHWLLDVGASKTHRRHVSVFTKPMHSCMLLLVVYNTVAMEQSSGQLDHRCPCKESRLVTIGAEDLSLSDDDLIDCADPF